MKNWLARAAMAVLICGIMTGYGCRSTTGTSPTSALPPLRVGVSPDYPPVIFKKNNKITGLEAELAWAMAKALGRPLQFVEVAWNNQISALVAGKTDIIMSGMTITAARQVRINFTTPFLTLGQMAIVRSKDAAMYPTAKNVLDSDVEIGVQRGSTGEIFAKRALRSNARVTCLEPKHAPYYLRTGRIDVFIHDGPAVIHIVSANEGDLAIVPEPLTQETLAWGVRKGDRALLEAANAALAQWKQDGTLDRLLKTWLPLWQPSHSSPATNQPTPAPAQNSTVAK